MSDELWRRSATELAAAIRRREVSCVEVMQAHLARIEAVNPLLNAIVTLDAELGLREAAAADAALGRGEAPGPLHGLPMAIKDLEDTAGMRTTYGSPIYRDHVPTADTLMVARLRRAGAIVIGKTNTPEFGAGSQTFNPVFGATRNPYDRRAHVAAAAAAARPPRSPAAWSRSPTGRISARASATPPSFCNLVGLRTARRARAGGAVGQRVEPDGRPRAAGAQRRGRRPAAAGDGRPRPARAAVARRSAGGLRARRAASIRAALRIAWSRNLGDLPVEPAVTRRAGGPPRGARGDGLRRRGRRAGPHGGRRRLRGRCAASATRRPSAPLLESERRPAEGDHPLEHARRAAR